MKVFASLLAMTIALGTSAVAFAQTTSETVTKTTVTELSTSPSTLVLPGNVSYYIVNPTDSHVIGDYVIGQTLSPGYYVISERTGEVMATVDSSGQLVSITTVPSALPTQFRLVNGRMFFYSTDFALRRADLEAKVAADYSAGRLTNKQVSELREKLGYIALLETKEKKDSTYSKSTVRKIEDLFAQVNGNMSKFVAETNSKKARIGIRVN
jgi:hypothetical protein